VFDIGNDLALNSELRPLDSAFQSGDMAVVQGLGYPGQNRSTLSLLLCGKPEEMEAKRVKMVG